MTIQTLRVGFLKDDIRKLLVNFASLSTLQILNYALPLITLPYLIRVLGAERFGDVMFAQSFIMYFNILVDFGFNLSATREISVHRDDEAKLTEIFSAVMTIKAFLLVLSLAILLLVVTFFDRFASDKPLYCLTFGMVVGQMLFPVWYFQGMENMKFITWLNILAKGFFTVMIFAVVKNQDDYLYVPLLNGLGFIIAGVVSLWIIVSRLRQRFMITSFETLKTHFVESTHFFWSRVSVSAYTSSNVFVLGLFAAPSVVGYYSIGEKLYSALQQFYLPIVQTLYPYIARQRNIALFKKVFSTAAFFNLACVAFLVVCADHVIALVSGQDLPQSILVFRILLAASLVVVPSIMLGYPFLAALGHKKFANYSVVIGSIFHVTLLSILVMTGIVTAQNVALLVVATEAIVLTIRGYGVIKYQLWSSR